MTNIDYENSLAIVAVVPGPQGEEEIVAIGQYFLDPHARSAEIAFIVQDEWQQQGIGTILLNYLIEIAQKRRINKFEATVMAENKAMLATFYNSGHPMKTEFDGEAYKITFELAKSQGTGVSSGK